jgi:hypothetical protein
MCLANVRYSFVVVRLSTIQMCAAQMSIRRVQKCFLMILKENARIFGARGLRDEFEEKEVDEVDEVL